LKKRKLDIEDFSRYKKVEVNINKLGSFEFIEIKCISGQTFQGAIIFPEARKSPIKCCFEIFQLKRRRKFSFCITVRNKPVLYYLSLRGVKSIKAIKKRKK